MDTFGRIPIAGLLLFWLALVLSCAGGQPKEASSVFSLEQGVERLGRDLLEGLSAEAEHGSVVAVDLFVDAESGEAPRGARKIESLLVAHSRKRFGALDTVALDTESQKKARWLVSGTISPGPDRPTVYLIRAAARDLQADRVIKRSEVRVTDADFDYSPMALYRDNPFFDPVYRKQQLPRETPRRAAAPLVEDFSIETLALLREASDAYERQKYRQSRALFERASDQLDGQTLWTYSGLYLTAEKLDRPDLADEAFEKILSLSVVRDRMLSVRFLFEVDSVEFWGDEQKKRRYRDWLLRIGRYFDRTAHCLQIVGHCSKTGPESWNESLSLMRALKIQRLLGETLSNAAKRTEAVGMGSKENVVGIGTDDHRDALDRRVELLIVDCR